MILEKETVIIAYQMTRSELWVTKDNYNINDNNNNNYNPQFLADLATFTEDIVWALKK